MGSLYQISLMVTDPPIILCLFLYRTRKGYYLVPICYMEGGSHTYDCPKFSPSLYLALPRPAPSLSQTFWPSIQFQAPNYGPRCFSDTRPPLPKRLNPEHCILYNKNNGNCPYGEYCIKVHVLSARQKDTRSHNVPANLHNCLAMHCTDF